MVYDASKKKAAQKKAAAAATADNGSVDQLSNGVGAMQISDRTCTGVLCSHPLSRDIRKKNHNHGNGDGEKEARDGGDKKREVKNPSAVVLKIEMHCEGCASKIIKLARGFQGVESVKAESESNKLTVNGKVDPSQIRDYLQQTAKRKVDLISPQPKKEDSNNHGNGDGEKEVQKEEAGDGGDKKKEAKNPSAVVLKMEMHCEGCASKIIKLARGFQGVESVKAESESNKLTVNGKVDPSQIRDYLQQTAKRKVDLISPQPKKEDSNNHGNGDGEKEVQKEEAGDGGDKKKEAKNPSAVVLKMEMHCEGCASKIIKLARGFQGVESVKAESESNKLTVNGEVDPSQIRDYLQQTAKRKVDLISPQPKKEDSNNHGNGDGEKEVQKKEAGVHEMTVDKQKETVTVKGTMDVKALTETLMQRLKRPVEIVPPKKDKDGKKDGDNAGGGGVKKKKGGSGGGGQDNAATCRGGDVGVAKTFKTEFEAEEDDIHSYVKKDNKAVRSYPFREDGDNKPPQKLESKPSMDINESAENFIKNFRKQLLIQRLNPSKIRRKCLQEVYNRPPF